MTNNPLAIDTTPQTSQIALSDPKTLAELRQQMLKFAISQLNDKDVAEDAVQEALIGAMKNVTTFGGRAALKTWVFAILKNKIADILRQKQRTVNVSSLVQQHDDIDDDDIFDVLFNSEGFWHADERPATWVNPEASIQDKHFWRVFEACLENLPAQPARIFMMREFIEMESHEICAEANITLSNLNVMLYRSRIRLRECLENNWFLKGETKCSFAAKLPDYFQKLKNANSLSVNG